VGSPHVHSSRLVPVSFAGFLIKCLDFISMTWAVAQVRPHVVLRGRFRAVWAISTRGVPAPVSNQLFILSPVGGSPWAVLARRSPQHKTAFFFSMTSCINFSGCATIAACRARCCVCIYCPLIHHCVHLRSLPSLTLWRPRRLPQPCSRALQFCSCFAVAFVPWYIVSVFVVVVFRSPVATPFVSSLHFHRIIFP
jgi:hypothetical protein